MYDLNDDNSEQRQRSGTMYGGNNPADGQVDQQGYGIPQNDQRERSGTVYGGNDPSKGSVDQQGYGIEQNAQQPKRSGRALPQTPADGVQRAWSGKFVSTYGGYGDENQGLLFKPTGSDQLHHFNTKETQQLRASDNSDLIKESMTHGAQGHDVVVTFSANSGQSSWGVQELNNQRPGRGK